MPHTNLVLGANWSADEWPESVDVMHEGVGDSLKYVPERTCKNSYVGGCTVEFKCSACGEHCFYPKKGNGKYVAPRYCPSCGAEVVS